MVLDNKTRIVKKYLPFVLFGIVITFFIVKILIENQILKSNHRYTVAIIKKISGAVDGGPDADFEYYVYGKSFSGFIEIKNFKKKVNVGDSFYLKFSTSSPRISEILVDMPIKCPIQQIPDSGWSSIELLPCH